MSLSATTIKLGIAAIVVGLIGAYLAQIYLAPEEGPEKEPPAPLSVPLASIDLPAGRVIKLGDVGLMSMTREQMKNRGWNLSQVMLSPEQVIGRTLKEPMSTGEPFETTALYPEGEGPNPYTRLKPGFRAVDLQVPLVRGGDAQVGDTVDVVFRSTPVEGSDTRPGIPEITVTLARAMEVIDVVSYGPKDPTITIAATPEQAQKFEVVRDKGEITLLARSPDDLAIASTGDDQPLSFNDLLGIEPPPPPPTVAQFNTVIYRRGKPSVNAFPITADDIARYSAASNQSLSPNEPTPAVLPPTPDEAAPVLPPVPEEPTPALPPLPTPATEPADSLPDLPSDAN